MSENQYTSNIVATSVSRSRVVARELISTVDTQTHERK